MEINLELQKQTITTRDGGEVEFDPAKLDAKAVKRIAQMLLDYGIGQKVRDGRTTAPAFAEETGCGLAAASTELMQSTLNTLYSGDWTARVASLSIPDDKLALINLVHATLKKNGTKRSPRDGRQAWQDWQAKTGSERLEAAEANAEAFTQAQVKAEIAAIKADRERKADEAERAEQLGSIKIKL